MSDRSPVPKTPKNRTLQPPENTQIGLGAAPGVTPKEREPAPDSALDLIAVHEALEEIHGADTLVGKVLNRIYRLEKVIGQGGMGAVYIATHLNLQKQFAIKIIRQGMHSNPSALERFRKEAVAASRIDHPHIINVVNFDTTEDGIVFLVMDLLEGEDLAHTLLEGALPLDRSLRITYQIGEALNAAHAQGIIHRDLKPENIFLSEKDGQDSARILDFGISKMHVEDDSQGRITQTGQLIGTPRYISPEQAYGASTIDHRADIYSLGAMVYEMLCGKPPFEGRNIAQLLWQHANVDPIPPSKRVSTRIPAEIEKVVLRALSKDPACRFESVAEMMDALRRADRLSSHESDSQEESFIAPVRHKPNKHLMGLIGLSIAIFGALIFFFLRDQNTHPHPTSRSLPSMDSEKNRPTRSSSSERDQNSAEPVSSQRAERAEEAIPKDRVVIRFDSHPPGATVSIAGEVIGMTPVVSLLDPKRNRIRVKFEAIGYVPQVLTIYPKEKPEVTVTLKRKRASSPVPSTLPIKREL